MILIPPVGIDAERAKRLKRALEEAGASLDAAAKRAQLALNESGADSLAPVDLRRVAAWCNEQVGDLDRRIRAAQDPEPPTRAHPFGRDVPLLALWGRGLATAANPARSARRAGPTCGSPVAPVYVMSCGPFANEREVLGQPAGESGRSVLVTPPPPPLGGNLVNVPVARRGPVRDESNEREPELVYQPSPKHDQRRPGSAASRRTRVVCSPHPSR